MVCLFFIGDLLLVVIVNEFGEVIGFKCLVLIGCGVVLFFLTICVNVVVNVIVYCSIKRSWGVM